LLDENYKNEIRVVFKDNGLKNGRVESKENGLIKWIADGTTFVSFMAYTNTTEELIQIEVDGENCTELFENTNKNKYLLYPHESLIFSVSK